MKPLIKYIGILLLGVGVGILVGFVIFSNDQKKTDNELAFIPPKTETKIITKTITDTVYLERKSSKQFNTEQQNDTLNYSDSIEIQSADSLDTNFNQENIAESNAIEENEDDLVVFTDKLIEQQKVEIQKIKNEDLDSTDSERIFNLKTEKFNGTIMVEYWSSPLDLTGYELSRNTLKLYGFNPDETITLINKEGENILNLKLNNLNLALEKTDKFKTLYF